MDIIKVLYYYMEQLNQTKCTKNRKKQKKDIEENPKLHSLQMLHLHIINLLWHHIINPL